VATEIVMPNMGYDMTEGKLLRWLKRDGDAVAKGEAVAEIETDKVAIELEAFSAGILRNIQVSAGETVAVGTRLAILAAPDEDLTAVSAPSPLSSPVSIPAQPPVAASTPTPVLESGQRDAAVNASPLARRTAREHGVDLSQVQGTGPGGRITREDVIAASEKAPGSAEQAGSPSVESAVLAEQESTAPKGVETPAAPPAEDTTTSSRPLTRLQQTIGRRMVESKTQAPHFYVTVHADMTEAMALRRQLNAGAADGARISVNDLIVKAVARTLVDFPVLNATFAGDTLTLHQEIAVCVAVALDEGLVTPVVHHAERLTLRQIARETHELVERTRGGKGRVEDYAGGTFTVSNLGMFNVDSFVAIINPPQAAILAVGSVQRLPVYVGEELVPRQLMSMTLSADHRITDGATAARFLARVCDALQQPVLLLE
jgi:pyruvate dehydrogenase E2 component (dihydrolipoamide acetyltransferase)